MQSFAHPPGMVREMGPRGRPEARAGRANRPPEAGMRGRKGECFTHSMSDGG